MQLGTQLSPEPSMRPGGRAPLFPAQPSPSSAFLGPHKPSHSPSAPAGTKKERVCVSLPIVPIYRPECWQDGCDLVTRFSSSSAPSCTVLPSGPLNPHPFSLSFASPGPSISTPSCFTLSPSHMAPMTLCSAKLPCLHPSHLPWDGSLVASDKEQNPRGFSPGNVVMEAAPQERQLLSLNILTWHHQRKLGSLREAPDRSGLRPLQEPMKTSTTLGERAGKSLSILCAPITTLEVTDPVQLIHTLIPARPGQPLLPHRVPPTHKDRASSSPCPDHISARPRRSDRKSVV